jgi:phenylacetate-CoA ligase
VTAAEGLRSGQRDLVEEQLVDEVFQSYGSREFMMIGMECWKHEGYHLVGTNLQVEVVDETGKPSDPGETGRILVTDLRNDANPFIRYEIGDLGAMAPHDYQCPCGLPFPMLQRVDGRTQEVIVNANGDRLTALFIPHLMKEFDWIDGYQIAQQAPGIVEVRLVTQTDLATELTTPVTDALRSKLGADMTVSYRRMSSLAKSPSGKTPIVIRGREPTNDTNEHE